MWPVEVNRLAGQIEHLADLEPEHQRKVKHHINTLLLEREPSGVIIATAQALTSTFGNLSA